MAGCTDTHRYQVIRYGMCCMTSPHTGARATTYTATSEENQGSCLRRELSVSSAELILLIRCFADSQTAAKHRNTPGRVHYKMYWQRVSMSLQDDVRKGAN